MELRRQYLRILILPNLLFYIREKKSVLRSVGFSLLKIRGQLLNVIALHLKKWGRREGKHTLPHGPKALRFYFFPKFMGVLNKNVTVKEAGAVTFLRLSTQLGSYTWDTCRISSLGCLEKKLSSLQLILIEGQWVPVVFLSLRLLMPFWKFVVFVVD